MAGFSECVKQFRELLRIFTRRFLENDLMCVDGDTRGTLVGVLSMLIAPGVFLPMLEYLNFGSWPLGYMPWTARDFAAIPDKIVHIALSMTVLGLMTVLEWDAILPDRRDVAVLRPFPVGLGTVFAAKVSALFWFWAVFTVAVDGIPAIFLPVAIVQSAPSGVLLRFIAAHGLALLTANLFVFLAMIAVQGLLMTVLGRARFHRFAPYAQFMLVAGLLSIFFLSVGVISGLRTDQPPPSLVMALPPYWFVGVGQILLGRPQPLFDALAGSALPALVIAAGAASLTYAWCYRRAIYGVFEVQDGPVAGPGRLARWTARLTSERLLRSAGERATFFFVWRTVMRSRSHRLLIAAWTGAAAAVVLLGIMGAITSGDHEWWRRTAGPLLPLPVILPLFLITGLRFAFTVPAELRGNWIFQLGGSSPGEYLAGARKAALALALALCALLLPVLVMAWGARAGALHALFGGVMAWLLVEAEMAGLEKLPFTCSYVPGKSNMRSCWLIYLLGCMVYVTTLSWIGLKILEAPSRIFWFIAAALAVRTAIGCYHRQLTYHVTLTFDERPAPAVQTLELDA